MPQNDMGTAHGSIRIDYEDRGATKAVAALQRLEKQFQLMNDRLGKIEKTLTATEKTFEKTSVSVDRASRATQGFSKDIFSAHKSVTAFSRDIRALYSDLNKLNDSIGRMKDISRPFVLGYKTIDLFNQRTLDGSKRANTFRQSLIKAGVASAVFNKTVVQNMIGVKSAMAEMPRWSQNAYQFAGYMAKAGAATMLLNKALSPEKIGRYINAFANTGPVRKLLMENDKLAAGFEKTARMLERLPGTIDRSIRPMANFAVSSRGLISGLALVNSGIKDVIARFQWLARIPAPIKYAFNTLLANALPAALNVLGKALTATSNLAAGLWDGIKTLSGGFLALPGLVASVASAIIPLGLVFAGLKDKLKDVFSDDLGKSLQAYYSLPAAIRPAIDAIKGLQDQFKQMQERLQEIAFKDVGEQIKALGATYLPVLEKGSTGVLLAFRKMKDEMFGFLMQSQTIKDVNKLYANTAGIIQNLGYSIRPALDGLRNIGIVGSDFISQMSAGMPRLAQRFAEFAELNRQNGRLMMWMTNAKEGVDSLIRGTVSLTSALYKVLTMFQTGPQTNFLNRFAVDMDKFNQAVERSATSGALRRIGNDVRGFLNMKTDGFKAMIKSVMDFFDALFPVINSVAQAFSGPFLTIMKEALIELGLVAKAIHSIGLDSLIGWIWGATAGWKAFSNIMVPIAAKLKIIYGSFLVLRDVTKVIGGIESAALSLAGKLEMIPVVGGKISSSIVNVAGAVGPMLARMASMIPVIGSIVAAVGAVVLVWQKANDETRGFNNALSDSQKAAQNFGRELNKAFQEDGGMKGKTVMDTVTNGVATMFDNLDNMAKNHPNVMSHIKDFFDPTNVKNNIGFDIQGNWRMGGDTDATNKMQAQSDEAKHAAEQLRQLQKSGTDLTAVLTGSDESFNKFIDNLKATSKEPAAKALQEYRDQVVKASNDAKILGENGEKLAQGFDKVAQSAGNATQKLDGMRLMLQGLGLLKTTTVEAVAQYNTAIDELVQKSQEAIENGDGLDKVWNQQTHSLDVNSKSGQNLIGVWSNVSNAFLSAAANGGNVDEMLGKIDGAMKGLADATGVSEGELRNYFATTLGINPVVKIGVQLDNKDPVVAKFGELMMALQAQAQTGVAVRINFGSDDAAKQFVEEMKQKLGQHFADAFGAGNSSVFIKPGVQLSQDDMNKLNQFLNDHGIQTSATPAAPAQIAPKPATPGTPPPPQAPGAPAATAPAAPGAPAANSGAQVAQGVVDTTMGILVAGGQTAGEKFVEALATGIGRMTDADKAAEKLAEGLIGHFHQSPPKKGPLSAHGDAAKYAGRAFVSAYASGMRGQSITAADAAASIGMAASSGVASGGGKGIENAGKMLGQVSDMMNFMDHVVNAFRGGFEGLVGTLKFLSDPGQKGTFFGMAKGQAFGYSKSPESEAQRLDKLQNIASSMYSTGTRDLSGIDTTTGLPKVMSPGALGATPSAEDVKKAIVAKGQAAGASQADILAALAVAQRESGFVNQVGKGKGGDGTDAVGVFQQSPYQDAKRWGKPEDLLGNVDMQIDNYWREWAKTSGKPEDRASAVQAAGAYGAAEIAKEMAAQGKTLGDILKSGPLIPTQQGTVPGIGAIPGMAGTTPILHDSDGLKTQPQVAAVATMLANMFPFLTNIGGARKDAMEWHPNGRGLDVMIPGASNDGDAPTPPEALAMGNKIADFLALNGKQLGINGYIWQNQYHLPNGQVSGTNQPGHKNHVHIQWNDGATIDMGPNGSNIRIPLGSSQALGNGAFGVPNIPGTPGYGQQGQAQQYTIDPGTGKMTPVQQVLQGGPLPADMQPKSKLTDDGLEVYDAGGNLIQKYPRTVTENMPVRDAAGRVIGQVVPGAKPGDPATLAPAESWNPLTGAPFTDEERKKFADDHPLQYTPPTGTTQRQLDQISDPANGIYFGDQQSFQAGLGPQDQALIQAAYGNDPKQAAMALQALSGRSQAFIDSGTAGGRQQGNYLNSIINDAASSQGMAMNANPIDAIGSAAGSISGAIQSIFSTINSVVESVGATKDITGTLVRGIENTEDINRIVDDVQKYIELAANIAGTVANVASAAGSIASAIGSSNPMGGSGGASAALEGVSAVASGIQAALQTTNAIIDLAQEAYHIWGSYYGQFQGMLAGGPEGMLMGNVRYLLDQNTNQLLAYSSDNPADKRAHDLTMAGSYPEQRNQLAGNIIVYGGPGSDPRDDTRQMMFQVKQATMGQAVVGP